MCMNSRILQAPVPLLDGNHSAGYLLGKVHVAIEPLAQLFDQPRAVP